MPRLRRVPQMRAAGSNPLRLLLQRRARLGLRPSARQRSACRGHQADPEPTARTTSKGYFSFYAPDLTWWGPGGRSDKDSYHKMWTESVKTTGGLASAENSDLRIQVSPGGDLAVASYLLKVARKNPGTEPQREHHLRDVADAHQARRRLEDRAPALPGRARTETGELTAISSHVAVRLKADLSVCVTKNAERRKSVPSGSRRCRA